MVEIRQPNITATDQQSAVAQMRSYLYQLSNQLNWAFQTMQNAAPATAESQTIVVSGGGKKETPEETFGKIKDLIIKSAEIVDAYSEEIERRISGVYVAQSEFGTFTETTEQAISENSTNITQLFQNTQSITNDISDIRDESERISERVDSVEEEAEEKISASEDRTNTKIIEVSNAVRNTNAYIRTGLLGYREDATPIYGVEVGQKNEQSGQEIFDKFARFTADKLSFYDTDDTEVAYISDYKLYITNAIVTGSLQLMSQFQIVQGNGTIDFKWMGG